MSPLNPASFGKLVRIIFPGIQTRRLGMRGESKYHYVDLTLIDDPPEAHSGEHFQDTGDVAGATDSLVTRGYVTSYRDYLLAFYSDFDIPACLSSKL